MEAKSALHRLPTTNDTSLDRAYVIRVQMSDSDLREIIEAVSEGDSQELMVIALEESQEAQKAAEENAARLEDVQKRVRNMQERIGPSLDLLEKVGNYASLIKWVGGAGFAAVSVVGLRQAIEASQALFRWLLTVI